MIFIPQRKLGDALERSSDKIPTKVAILGGGMAYTYADLRNASYKVARYLVNKGIEKGDRIAVFMNNSFESAVSIYGISLAGGVFMVINPQSRGDKLKYFLEDSSAKIVITEKLVLSHLIKSVSKSKSLVDIITVGGSVHSDLVNLVRIESFGDILYQEYPGNALPLVIPNDLAALIYTSGSTGFPKGVMMTHQSMVFATWSLIEYLRLSEDDRIMLVLPLAFDYGLYQLLMSVALGSTLIMEHSFTFPATIYKQIEKLKPTIFPGVPTIFAMMIASHKNTGLSFDSIQKITSTAAALPAEYLPFLKKIFPYALIFKMYGLTECKRVSYLEPELIDEKPASVGKAIPGTEVFILDDEGKEVTAGKPGMLHVRGPHVMAGYWNKKEESEKFLKPGKIPGERILCTHDLFKMDEEGFLYFLGRTDNIIKTRGEKVSPVEIENVIYKIPGIREVAVLGIPDEIMGESIVAFITLAQEGAVTEKKILETCAENMELFMMPQKLFFQDEMPRSFNGKIDKDKLKEYAGRLLRALKP